MQGCIVGCSPFFRVSRRASKEAKPTPGDGHEKGDEIVDNVSQMNKSEA